MSPVEGSVDRRRGRGPQVENCCSTHSNHLESPFKPHEEWRSIGNVCVSAQLPTCLHVLPADRDLSSCCGKCCEAATGPASLATAGMDPVAKRGGERCVNCPFHTDPLMWTPSLVIMKQERQEYYVLSSCYILGQLAAAQTCENCGHPVRAT